VVTQQAESLFTAMGLTAPMHLVVIPGKPAVKSRPRFARGRAHSKPEDRAAETRTAWHLKAVVHQPLTGNVGIVCVFYRPDRRVVDADNMVKHVCDAANGVLWRDDSQCTAIAGVVELDAASPRTVIAIGGHNSSLIRAERKP
jgi:Holliday junction resolvase RusA-like endonuclease